MAARNFEDFLQVCQMHYLTGVSKLSGRQCAIPVFEGLLPEPHNGRILKLLFTFAHWHGLAKLRMHTDTTLSILDNETTILGQQLRDFQSKTCPHFQTRELKSEAAARQRRQSKKGMTVNSSLPTISKRKPEAANQRLPKMLNLQTYKAHAVGDYVDAIKRYGTTDSYTSEIVSVLLCVHRPST
jgi:hypothetical protein